MPKVNPLLMSIAPYIALKPTPTANPLKGPKLMFGFKVKVCKPELYER
ncbi:MAG: hypothetical protein BWX66_01834 [Deltaproteobacteria bacterium ADurb.Bin058]|nr:MAG: hypothetical protein BWX66_01834 [Deltaproteobacteria bacterium ADurb.Bin058]